MTFRLTGLAGMELNAGWTVARAGNSPDEDWREPVGATGRYLTGRLSADKMREAASWHFPLSPNGRVEPGSDEAKTRYRDALDDDHTSGLAEREVLVMFGEGLHVLQDSYSHQGRPVLAGVGHPKGAVRVPGVGVVALRRGVPTMVSKSADCVKRNWTEARATGMETWHALKELREAMPHLFPGDLASDREVMDWLEKWYPKPE